MIKVKFRERKKKLPAADVVVLPCFKGERTEEFREFDSLLKGLLTSLLKKRPTLSEAGRCEFVHAPAGRPGILVAGMGEAMDIDGEVLRRCGGSAAKALAEYDIRHVSISVHDLTEKEIDYLPLIEGFLLRDYSFQKYRSLPEPRRRPVLTVLKKETGYDRKRVRRLTATVESVHFVRDLVNTPSNHLVPSTFASMAKELAGGRLSVKVMGPRGIARLGMNALLSVAKGSREEPRFIVMEYMGGGSTTIGLVGKCITFDSGGISLKPSEGMEKMKYDMAGGAVVLGVMKALKSVGAGGKVVGVIPACENLPGGAASKPGDVVKTFSGKSVEIVSTDAEGRLILADAIGYTKKLSPDVIIDIATLTGACSVALGNEAIAMMGTSQEWMDRLKAASQRAGERVWQMPLYEDYGEYLRSEIADIRNSGGRSGSLVTAGYFLKEFAGSTPWVHLDIASTAWTEKERPYTPRGASGIGVRLLMDLIGESLK